MALLIPPSRRADYEQRALKCLIKRLRYLKAMRRIEQIPRWWFSSRARRLMKRYEIKQGLWSQAQNLWLRHWAASE